MQVSEKFVVLVTNLTMRSDRGQVYLKQVDRARKTKGSTLAFQKFHINMFSNLENNLLNYFFIQLPQELT